MFLVIKSIRQLLLSLLDQPILKIFYQCGFLLISSVNFSWLVCTHSSLDLGTPQRPYVMMGLNFWHRKFGSKAGF